MERFVNLFKQLMLAARYREDHAALPGNCVDQCVIGGRITGMKRDDHVCMIVFVSGNVADKKLQPITVQIRGNLVAEGDDILFQIQSDNFHVFLFDDAQIVPQRKGKIGLAAAEVDDFQCPILRKFGKNILDNFQKTIDLTEFAVMTPDDLSVLIHYPQTDEKVAGSAVGKQITLFFVVRKAGHTFCRRS